MNISCTVAIRIGWWVVVRFYRMPLLSAKCPRPPRRRNPYERRFGEYFEGQLLHVVHWWDTSQIPRERDKAWIRQFGKKVSPGIFLGYALIAVGFLERRHSGCWYWRIRKVGRIRNLSQKTECKISPNNQQRRRICISCGRWFSNIIRKRLRIPRTHSETGTHRKERESQRRISRR